MSELCWVIWSEEHGAWWAPGEQGYTRFLTSAGRYTRAEAFRICADANRYCQPPAWKECCFALPPELQEGPEVLMMGEIK